MGWLVKERVAELNDEERQLLQQYRNQSPEERTRRLNAALDAMSEGLSQAQLDEMTAAMTEDYIEAWDESEWAECPMY